VEQASKKALSERSDRDLLEAAHGNSIATLQTLDSKASSATNKAHIRIDQVVEAINKLNGRVKKLEGIIEERDIDEEEAIRIMMIEAHRMKETLEDLTLGLYAILWDKAKADD